MSLASSPDPWLKLIQAALFSGQNLDEASIEWQTAAEEQPATEELPAAEWRQVVETIIGIQRLAASLAKGDLTLDLRLRGTLAGSLKTLQADLRHLTWQVQQVATGDLTQQVDFMGDFAAAFNVMIQNLRQARQELQESEARYRLLAENAQDVIWTLDLTTLHFTYVSPSVKRLRGFTPEEVLQQSLDQVLCPGSLEVVEQSMQADLEWPAGNAPLDGQIIELEQPCKDGSTVWTEVTTTRLVNSEGRVVGIQGVSRDASERRRARQAEAEQHALAEALRDTSAALNSAMTLDAVLDSLLGNLGRVVPHENALILMIDETLSAYPVRWSGFEKLPPEALNNMADVRLPIVLTPNLRSMTESGRPCCIGDVLTYADWQVTPISAWVRAYLGAPIVVEGKAAGFLSLYSTTPNYFTPEHVERLVIFADQAAIAIQKARLFDELQRLATTDPLTGAPNRRHFFERGEAEFARAIRYGTPLSALMLDADHFKTINDSFGHAAGDDVLRQIVQICLDSLRRTDIFGRYGGEEFAVLLPHTDERSAQAVAERIHALCAARLFETSAGPVQATVSIGVAGDVPGAPSLQVLLNRADQALYAAKAAGRNCVRSFADIAN